MRDRFKWLINLLVFFSIPIGLFSQPVLRDPTEAYNYWAQHGITAKNIFLPLKRACEQHKPFDDQFFKVPDYYENYQYWDRNNTELLASYSNSLNGLILAVETIQEPEKKSETIPDESSDEKGISGWMWILMVFLLGLMAGGFLIYQYSKLKIYSILKREKHEYLDDLKQDTRQSPLLRKFFKYIGIIAVLKQSKDEKKKDFDNCLKENVQLKRENEELKRVNQPKGKVQTDQKIAFNNEVIPIDNIDGQPGRKVNMNGNQREIFFTIPENDGSFKIINARNYKEVDCFYKISMDESGQRGKLHFISGEYDLRALDNIDYYLNPVCEIQNITNRTYARKIEMVDTGSVRKRGDYWKIEDNNKVKIKLV